MRTEKKIFKNTLLLTAGQGLGDLCSFIFLVYFARVFGASILGKYSVAMSTAGLLTVVTSLGFNSLLVREVSKNTKKSTKFIGNLILVRGILSLLVWCIIGLGCYFTDFPQDTRLILLLICGYHIFCRLTNLIRSSFRAHDCMHYSVFLEIYHKVIILILGIGCIVFFRNPVITLTMYPLSAGTMFIIAMIIYVKKIGRPVFTLDFPFIKDSIAQGFPFFFIIIMAQIYDRVGIILLTMIKGESITGLFSASDRILATLNAGAVIFSGVLLPYMSKLSAQSKEQLYKLSERSMRVMYIIFLSLAVFIFILSEKIILLTFGDQFSESVKVLQILVWSFLFMGLNQIIANLLIVNYKEKTLLRIRAIAYLLYCVISFIFIWKWSFIGLAWSKLIVEASLFSYTIFYAFDISSVYEIFRQMLIPFASCILTILLYFFLKGTDSWLILSSVICFYILTLFLFKGIFVHDFLYLKEIVFQSDKKT